MENMDSFATVAFSFVLGYAERALHNESKMKKTVPVEGKRIEEWPREKTETTKRLEMAVAELHRLWNVWNGMEG